MSFIHLRLCAEEVKSMNPENLAEYQTEVYRDYGKSISLPDNYCFLNYEPVKPLPPVQATAGGIMIVGAYPSAIFQRINKRIVPVKNLNEPFDPASHDVSKNKSADELDQKILEPLGITRSMCWITNLVKVFLFKPEHVKQFLDFKSSAAGFSTRDDFEIYAKKSLPWIFREIELSQPKLIITLGAEVAGNMREVKGKKARNDLLNYKIAKIMVGQREYRIVHFAHPGILMRGNPKWLKIHNEGLKELKADIQALLTKENCVQPGS